MNLIILNNIIIIFVTSISYMADFQLHFVFYQHIFHLNLYVMLIDHMIRYYYVIINLCHIQQMFMFMKYNHY